MGSALRTGNGLRGAFFVGGIFLRSIVLINHKVYNRESDGGSL